jgi:putative alpha-1,2-mannosidase
VIDPKHLSPPGGTLTIKIRIMEQRIAIVHWIWWSTAVLWILAAQSALATPLLKAREAFNVLDYVDPLIGTSAGGHVFPGPTMPFGMAKPVADVFGENQGGFTTESNSINGFSHMHDSGTGGSDDTF